MMNERERSMHGSAPGTGNADPLEERVRSLYAAAYPPAYPSAEPSEELERRVAELAAQHDAQAAQPRRGWVLPLPWGHVAGAMTAAALMVALGLLLTKSHHRPHDGILGPSTAGTPPPPRSAPGSRSPLVAPEKNQGPQIADRHLIANLKGKSNRSPGLPPPTPDQQQVAEGSPRVVPPRTHLRPPAPPVRGLDDMVYVNSDPELVNRPWARVAPDEWDRIERQVRSQVRVKDDFVTIPFPQLAAISPRLIAGAAESYKRQAAIVDPRLTREVTLACKGMALSDLCDHLREETGIELTAGPSAADEKVTIFCEKRPVRDLMREINRTFGFTWLRSGRQGAFKYELEQDLKSQFLEEALRSRDWQATLLKLDAQMQQFRPYMGMSFEELEKRWDRLPDEKKRRPWERLDDNSGIGQLWLLVAGGGWGGVQLYDHLTPRDRDALMAGEGLVFRSNAPDPDRRLPPEWGRQLLMSMHAPPEAAGQLAANAEAGGRPFEELELRVNRSELGQVSLTVGMWADPSAPQQSGGHQWGFVQPELVTARSPSAANPNNAADNAVLRHQPPFDQVVSLLPKPSCPAESKHQPGDMAPRSEDDMSINFDPSQPHASSADVWEAVHRATGMPIVADYYTHLYPLSKVTVERQSLLQALCSVGDALDVRWRKDGDFLVCRSASFFWDRLQEVPNRYLQRWAQDRDAGGGLPLADLLEMASMSDQQLDSEPVAQGIERGWGLREWAWIRKVGPRQDARCLALLTPEQLCRAQQPAGLPFTALAPAQQQRIVQLQYERQERMEQAGGAPTGSVKSPAEFASEVVMAFYIPAGWHLASLGGGLLWWTAPRNYAGGRTAAEALAAARQRDPRFSADKVWLARDGYFSAGIGSFGLPPTPSLTGGASLGNRPGPRSP